MFEMFEIFEMPSAIVDEPLYCDTCYDMLAARRYMLILLELTNE